MRKHFAYPNGQRWAFVAVCLLAIAGLAWAMSSDLARLARERAAVSVVPSTP